MAWWQNHLRDTIDEIQDPISEDIIHAAAFRRPGSIFMVPLEANIESKVISVQQ